MRWTPGGVSSDVEDRRGSGGGFGRTPQIGCGGAVVLLVLSLIFGKNFFTLVDGSGGGSQNTRAQTETVAESPEERREVEFVSFVLDDAQATWEQQLPRYRHAKLVLFRDSIDSACGYAEAATGPFYCPADEKVYIDLSFYDELHQRFGAPGDFAEAYVIAHEIGHHVQNLQGITSEHGKGDSVAVELQADCYAGIWAHSTQQRNVLESGDAEEGIDAAAAVGDDRLQRAAGRRVNPDSFTHGSSAQRVQWFQRGFESGRIEDCDTFR